MELIENLFVGGNVTDLETIVYSLRREELLSSHELFHTRNKNRPAKIAGIAMGREETVDLLLFMAKRAQEEGRNPANPRELML